MGGYFFLVIATTMATMVAVKIASNVRAANIIEKASVVVISFTPFLRECQLPPYYVVAKLSLT